MKRYNPQGVLALDPQAFGAFFVENPETSNESADGVTVVTVRGPLDHHDGGWCDSYDAIRERMREACESAAPAIVMRLDSPGGDARGCMDAARALRAMAQRSGKRLVAFVEGQACSAAYAIACAAERIVISPTASVGSIGVIATRVDATAMDEAVGLKYSLLTSGARKAYGNPHTEMSGAEAAEAQGVVDWLAGSFFELVAEMRGLDAKAVAGLEAGVLRGADAVRGGLADELGTIEALLATAGAASPAGAGEGGPMADEKDDDKKDSAARKALKAVIDDDKSSDDDKKEARKALKALDDEDDDKAEGDDDSDKKDGDAKGKAKATKAEGDDKDEDEPGAKASAAPLDVDALIEAKLRARDEKAEREQLLASRPDLDADTKELLAAAPIEKVRAYVKKAPRRAFKPAAAASAQGTRGEGQGDDSAITDDPELAAVDRAMGLDTAPPPKAVRRGNTLYLGRVPTDDNRS